MNVLRKCYDCAQYRYEVYCDPIDGAYFCEQCHDKQVREGEGVNHEKWDSESVYFYFDMFAVGCPVCG